MNEILSQKRLRFQERVCKDCIYFVPDPNVGLGKLGGRCDVLDRTGQSRLKCTPPGQMYKTCPLKRTSTGERQPRPRKQFSFKKTERSKATNPAMARRGRKAKLTQIEALRENGEIVGTFGTVAEAATAIGLPVRKVYKLLAGETKNNDTGYIFRKAEERNE